MTGAGVKVDATLRAENATGAVASTFRDNRADRTAWATTGRHGPQPGAPTASMTRCVVVLAYTQMLPLPDSLTMISLLTTRPAP